MAQKPKLNLRELEVLIRMHRAEPLEKSMKSDCAFLVAKGLACYSEGWKLTKEGKQIARHLTGVK